MPLHLPPHRRSAEAKLLAASLLAACVVALCACSDSTPIPDTTDSGATPEASSDGPSPEVAPIEVAIDGPVELGADAKPDSDEVRPTRDASDRDAGGADARTTDAGDADEPACAPEAVWPSTGHGFTYRESGGWAGVPIDAGCVGPFTTFDYAAATQTLAENSCTWAGPRDRTILLSGQESSQLVALLNGLRTNCPDNTCGEFYPEVTLEVRTAAGATAMYTGDVYAGCGPSQFHPPYVADSHLDELSTLLRGFVAAACADAGGDASTCRNDPPDQRRFGAAAQ